MLVKALGPPLPAAGSVCPALYGVYSEIRIQPFSSLWLLENGNALSLAESHDEPHSSKPPIQQMPYAVSLPTASQYFSPLWRR